MEEEVIITQAEYRQLPDYQRQHYECWALKGDVIKALFKILSISINDIQKKIGKNPYNMKRIITGKQPICIVAVNAIRGIIEEASGNTIPKTMIARCILK